MLFVCVLCGTCGHSHTHTHNTHTSHKVRPSFSDRLKISKGRRDPESEGETEGGRGDIERKRVKGERLREAERDFTNKMTNQPRPHAKFCPPSAI